MKKQQQLITGLIVLLVLAGLGTGLYFLLREDKPTTAAFSQRRRRANGGGIGEICFPHIADIYLLAQQRYPSAREFVATFWATELPPPPTSGPGASSQLGIYRGSILCGPNAMEFMRTLKDARAHGAKTMDVWVGGTLVSRIYFDFHGNPRAAIDTITGEHFYVPE
jgi:hypothetical protein